VAAAAAAVVAVEDAEGAAAVEAASAAVAVGAARALEAAQVLEAAWALDLADAQDAWAGGVTALAASEAAVYRGAVAATAKLILFC
jgi:hypothetical protein